MTGTGAGRRLRDGLPLVPFLAYVLIFLVIPTLTVVVGSVYLDGVLSPAGTARCSPRPP